MSFELDTAGTAEIDARAETAGVPLGMPESDPGFFAGTGRAGLQGLARGTVAKSALLVGDAATPVLKPTARAVDKALGTSLDAWLDEQQRRNRQALDDLRPDPLTTGFAGQVVGGLLDLGSSALIYTPEGAAVLEGYGRRQELLDKGVDADTATTAGAVTGAATLLGVKAPVTLGRAAAGQGAATVARNASYGAGVGVGAGVAERGTTQEVLSRAGYADQAAMNQPFDLTALAADAALGAIFSGGASALDARFTAKGQDVTDAALATRQARHAMMDTAPGVPADPASSSAHASALGTALEQALRNEPVNVGEALADTTFVRQAAGQGRELNDELQRHVADLLPAPSFLPPANAPRGIRSNNPGNLRATGERWQGQTGADGGFVTFESPQAGVRALARTLITYQDRHGLNTVQGIIGRWAPPGENNTPAYVLAVARAMGIEPTAELNVRDPITMGRLVEAIVRHENGQQPYPEVLIRGGIDDALSGRDASAPVAYLLPMRPRAAESGTQAGRAQVEAVPTETAAIEAAPATTRAKLADDLAKLEASIQGEAQQPGGAMLTERPEAGGARQAAPIEFTTAKGSVYQVHDDGTTTRNKAAREDAGHEGDSGPKERTVRTVYVDTDAAALSAAGLSGLGPRGARVVLNDGKATLLTWSDKEGRWGAAASARDVPVHDQPAIGRHPLELWAPAEDVPGHKAFSRMHAGNRIVGIEAGRAMGRPGGAPAAEGARPDSSRQAGVDAGSNPVRGTAPTVAAPVPGEAATRSPQAADPTMAAAAEVAALRPDMLVAMEDGTELPAAEVLARAEVERVQAEQDARAFEAAVHCFLRS